MLAGVFEITPMNVAKLAFKIAEGQGLAVSYRLRLDFFNTEVQH